MTNTSNSETERWQSLGLDPETYKRLSEIAASNGRTLIGQIRWWIAREQMYSSISECAAALPSPVKE